MDAIIVLVVQAVFMFFIDHKYRFLHSGHLIRLLTFQATIATMYVFVIPMIASGESITAVAYIAGSVLGTYISHVLHIKKG